MPVLVQVTEVVGEAAFANVHGVPVATDHVVVSGFGPLAEPLSARACRPPR